MEKLANWLGHIMRRNGLLRAVIEGKVEVTSGTRDKSKKRRHEGTKVLRSTPNIEEIKTKIIKKKAVEMHRSAKRAKKKISFIQSILERTGYTLDVTTGQRKYGGPPPGWEGPTPGSGCEVFCGKVPKDMYEDELIPLFEKCGTIWDLRLMMDPMTGLNRGYAFITFTTRSSAQSAVRELDNHEIKPGKTLKVNISVPNLRLFVGNIPKSKGKEEILEEFGKLAEYKEIAKLTGGVGSGWLCPCQAMVTSLFEQVLPQTPPRVLPRAHTRFQNIGLNDYEIRKGKKIGVTVSYNNHRLFVGNIPKNRDRDELFEEFSKHAPGLIEVIIYSSPDDKKKNRGFCFLEYESHKAASLAKRRLGTGRIKVWGCDIIVDWADPQEEPDEVTMAKVKVLYVRNLTQDCSEEKLKESFESYGTVERVKKIKDYAFIHFEDRDNAVKAMNDLNGKEMGGSPIEVSLAKPPSDKKKKEEILRARERRMMQMMQVRGGLSPSHPSMMPAALPMRGPGALGPRGAAAGPMRGPMGRGDYDYDYDYYGYGDYRGGYSDPYYDEYYRYEDYYFDYPPPPPTRGRGRQPQPFTLGALQKLKDTDSTEKFALEATLLFEQRLDPEEEWLLEASISSRGMRVGTQAGRGRGVVARGRAGGPPARGGAVRGAQRPAVSAARGGGRGGARGGPRGKGSLPAGKRKFDGGHQNQGETKRRYQSSWGNQPLAQQPLSNAYGLAGVNGGAGGYSSSGDQQWYQDTYPSWS
uniref:RRM domain-containing protein n=1 Tax=Timema genevievae TaxID=629358 RepID=A0A7R9PM18_TIMGE|nr:unnamed protein product [Timema genevievae]